MAWSEPAPAVVFAAGNIGEQGELYRYYGAKYEVVREGTGIYRIRFQDPCPSYFAITVTARGDNGFPVFCHVQEDANQGHFQFKVFTNVSTNVYNQDRQRWDSRAVDYSFSFVCVAKFADPPPPQNE